MKIAQHPGRGRGEHRRERLAPELDKGVALGVGHFGVEKRQIPVDQKFGLDQEGVEVVTRQRVSDARLDRQHVGQRRAMQRRQQIGRHLVARLDRRRRLAVDDQFAAEVFEHQQAGLAVGGENRRRGKAAHAQGLRHGDERRDAFGEMRDRAVGLAVAHRRSVRPLRRIHQDVARAVAASAARRRASRRRPACIAARPRRSRNGRGTRGSWRCARRARQARRSR